MRLKSWMIHAHGCHDDVGTCLVPANCIVYMLEKKDDFHYDDTFTNNIWHFSLMEFHQRLARGDGGDGALMEYAVGLTDIVRLTRNRMSWFLPGQVVNNISFSYDDPSFWSGCFELASLQNALSEADVREVRVLDAADGDFHRRMNKWCNARGCLKFHIPPSHEARVVGRPKCLHDALKGIESEEDTNMLHVVFVMTCRSQMRSRPCKLDHRGILAGGWWDTKQLLQDLWTMTSDYIKESLAGDIQGLIHKLECSESIKNYLNTCDGKRMRIL